MGSSQRAVPLQVAAAKSWVGHTEAASGVMGLLQAALGLQQLIAPGKSSVECHHNNCASVPIPFCQLTA